MSSERMLYIILYLLAIHSFCVGLALIITPAEMFAQFGYQPVTENFFPVQGGVFHLIMSFAYYLAAKNLDRERGLIILTITAKMAATVFLMLYYIFISPIWMVLLSGILDAMMGIIILILFRKFLNRAEKISE